MILPYVEIGRHARLTNVIVDRGVRIPAGLVVGEDPEADAARFRRTERGVCLITQPMIDRLGCVKRLRVLSVASEVYPLVKTGGLADVAGALPPALAREGIATRTLVPGYPAVHRRAARRRGGPRAARACTAGRRGCSPRTRAGLDLLVLDAPHLYARPGNPYLGPDGTRLARQRAALRGAGRSARRRSRAAASPAVAPDIVHAHDWQAGLVPALLHYARDAAAAHGDDGAQPVVPGAVPARAAAGARPAAAAPGRSTASSTTATIGYLKAGLALADRITTVSPTYAAEIRTPEGGMGLDGLLRQRAGVLTGILNGIDDDGVESGDRRRTSPRASTRGASPGARPTRRRCRRALGLDAEPAAPLFGVVSRLTRQKGMDLLLDALPALARRRRAARAAGRRRPALEAGFDRGGRAPSRAASPR